MEITVSCTDLAGNSSSETISFIIDSIDPVISSVTWRDKGRLR